MSDHSSMIMQFLVSLLFSSRPHHLPHHHQRGHRPPNRMWYLRRLPYAQVPNQEPKIQHPNPPRRHTKQPRTPLLTAKYNQTTAHGLLLLFRKGISWTPIVSDGIDRIWAPANLICVKR